MNIANFVYREIVRYALIWNWIGLYNLTDCLIRDAQIIVKMTYLQLCSRRKQSLWFKRFLKYLYCKAGIYLALSFNHSDLLEIFEMLSLGKRRQLAYLVLLYDMLHSSLDCPDLLQQINFLIPDLI